MVKFSPRTSQNYRISVQKWLEPKSGSERVPSRTKSSTCGNHSSRKFGHSMNKWWNSKRKNPRNQESALPFYNIMKNYCVICNGLRRITTNATTQVDGRISFFYVLLNPRQNELLVALRSRNQARRKGSASFLHDPVNDTHVPCVAVRHVRRRRVERIIQGVPNARQGHLCYDVRVLLDLGAHV
jgi:hypothetical protein